MNNKQWTVKQQIEAMIEKGEIRVGERLPSEHEMAKRFGVSRETFRAAARLLESEGKLLVKHGVGTFVIRPLPNIPGRLENLWSMGALIRSAHLEESERRESLRTEPCTEEVAEALGLGPGEDVTVMERIRTANDEAVVYSINHIPSSLIGEEMEKSDFSGSLLDFLQAKTGSRIIKADTELTVPLHIDRRCQRLLIHPHTTVLLLKQLHYDELNRPVLYSYDYLRSDVFRLFVRRTLE